MFFLWYCFDDWAAATLNTPALGHVPWVPILLLHVILLPLIKGSASVKISR